MISGLGKIWKMVTSEHNYSLYETGAFLQQNPIFSGLNEDELISLAHICYPRSFAQDEILFHESDIALASFIIQTGSIGIYKKTEDDIPERITCLYAGDIVGEECLAVESERSYQAIALEPSKLMVIFQPDFEKLAELQPEIGRKIYQRLIEKLYQSLLTKEDELRTLSNKLIKAQIII